MPRRRAKSIQQLNRECKECVLRYIVLAAVGLCVMLICLNYEQVNVPWRSPLLHDSDIVIMSYNVRGSDLDSGATTKWSARKPVALQMLHLYQADIIGVQEAQTNQIDAFVEMGYGVHDSHLKFEANSIFYNRSKYIAIDGDALWLESRSATWDSSLQRAVTWLLVKTKPRSYCDAVDTTQDEQCGINDDDDDDASTRHSHYLIFNTHLDHRGENSRLESCALIKSLVYNISVDRYKNAFPVFLTGDFNAAKYSNVHRCFVNDSTEASVTTMKDALHGSRVFAPWESLQLQFTYHAFRGLQMSTWYMRSAQFVFYGFSQTVVKWLRHRVFGGVCCMGPSLYSQLYRRREYGPRAGLHHLDWILYNTQGNDKINAVQYFEVVAYHHVVKNQTQREWQWSLKWLLHDRIVDKTIYPSDHFPVIAGFTLQ